MAFRRIFVFGRVCLFVFLKFKLVDFGIRNSLLVRVKHVISFYLFEVEKLYFH